MEITASNAYEDIMNDSNSRLTWSASDPMNGMTQASDSLDEDRGLVLNWADGESGSVSWSIPAEIADFTGHEALSFRACQGTRHPYTVALDDTLDFTVTLVDSIGIESSIRFGEMGEITTPYARTGSGSGSGWVNEFSTIRLSLADFQDSAIDLSDIADIRFDFGDGYSSSTGRIGIDDLMLEY